MSKAVVGPVLGDLSGLWTGRHLVLATAFYSAARLRATTITARSAELLIRLDLQRPDDWIARLVAPDALLEFVDRHPSVDIRMYSGPKAHAKVYLGDRGFFVGSANYTVRGLSGTSDEILWYESSETAVRSMHRALRDYRAALQPLSRATLADYVARFRRSVKERQRKIPPSAEAVLPPRPTRPPRLGTFQGFLDWLPGRGDAADEVLARARGKGNLSGHIRMNFFGIRQFLLAHPAYARALRRAIPERYRIVEDDDLQRDLRGFVNQEATDEGGLVVDTWRTYLPQQSGGKPKSGGGTQGNLNRMLPLMARYLRSVT